MPRSNNSLLRRKRSVLTLALLSFLAPLTSLNELPNLRIHILPIHYSRQRLHHLVAPRVLQIMMIPRNSFTLEFLRDNHPGPLWISHETQDHFAVKQNWLDVLTLRRRLKPLFHLLVSKLLIHDFTNSHGKNLLFVRNLALNEKIVRKTLFALLSNLLITISLLLLKQLREDEDTDVMFHVPIEFLSIKSIVVFGVGVLLRLIIKPTDGVGDRIIDTLDIINLHVVFIE
mmetsp:Transcript_3094/g.4530  ORF Transcript_3094/g.4530 Transcript_3094/m.4530 type:complete len:229 (-) Transcript_3094:1373-2059(-)